jgi:peptidoglycan/LPS O-acetylase OafA/YrhL
VGRLPCLDGLRGLAILFVLLSHLSLYHTPAFPGLDFTGSGFYGVCLFFTLSAYLLTSLLLQNSREELYGSQVWKQYFQRRVLRIYPLYALVLLANYFAASCGARFAEPLSLERVWNHLLLRDGAGVFWTIPVECHFYLLLPLIVLAGTLVPRRPLALLATACAMLGAVAWANATFPSDSRMALLRNVPAFLGGVYVAWASDWIQASLAPPPNSRARMVVEGAGWLAIAAVLLHIPSVWSWASGEIVAPDRFFNEPGLFGALWAVFLIAAIHGRGALRRVLSQRPLCFLGRISFSVYLLHLPLLKLIGGRLPHDPTLAAWGTIIAALGLATVTYFAIEKPFVAMGRSPRRRASGESTVPIAA